MRPIEFEDFLSIAPAGAGGDEVLDDEGLGGEFFKRGHDFFFGREGGEEGAVGRRREVGPDRVDEGSFDRRRASPVGDDGVSDLGPEEGPGEIDRGVVKMLAVSVGKEEAGDAELAEERDQVGEEPGLAVRELPAEVMEGAEVGAVEAKKVLGFQPEFLIGGQGFRFPALDDPGLVLDPAVPGPAVADDNDFDGRAGFSRGLDQVSGAQESVVVVGERMTMVSRAGWKSGKIFRGRGLRSWRGDREK